MSFRIITFCAGLLLFSGGTSAAQAVKLEFQDGRVNLSAQNAPVRSILAEWARLGGTRIVNGERVAGPPVTLELRGVPERQALDVVLRGVAGYMIAARDAGIGASRVDRIMILPTSTAPRTAAAPPPTFGAPPPQAVPRALPPPPLPQDDDAAEEDPEEDEDPAEVPVGGPGRGRAVSVGPVTGAAGAPPGRGAAPAQQPPPFPGPQTPAPQPAARPAGPSNPFTTLPGSSRPGEVTPAPPQQPRTAQPNSDER